MLMIPHERVGNGHNNQVIIKKNGDFLLSEKAVKF